MLKTSTYKYSNWSIGLVVILSVVISLVFKWSGNFEAINFMGGDAKDYYSSLVSFFITDDLINQTANEWYLLKTETGIVNVHPVGIAVLLLPFFIFAFAFAHLFSFPVDGFSLPFQISVAVAALFYLVVGLIFLKKFLRLQNVSDKVSAIIILLVYFGTNLLNYTLSEAGMSHVYSFALVSMFLYHSYKFVEFSQNKNLMYAAAIFGLILLVRPNNVFVMLTVFMWFKSATHCKQFFKDLFANKFFYLAILVTVSIVFVQSLVWYVQSGSLIQNTYKRDGFYWFNPQIFKMLFGFDSGFFIYTPMCLLFLTGLIALYKESKFSFISGIIFLSILFYFFASYWAYTYFDGLGIRVLVDYYAVFAFLGAKLFSSINSQSIGFIAVSSLSVFFAILNLVYVYQANHGILLRAGMTYNKWKFVFLKTAPEYQNRLGGSHELVPYSTVAPSVSLQRGAALGGGFDFNENEFGPPIQIEKLGFDSNRIRVELNLRRKEGFANASEMAQVCLSIEDTTSKEKKAYVQFRLNETPSQSCCEFIEYNYTANVVGDFKSSDHLSVYLWNIEKKPFVLDKFAMKVYNYKYQLN